MVRFLLLSSFFVALFSVVHPFLPYGITMTEPVSFLAFLRIDQYKIWKNGTVGISHGYCGASIIRLDVLLTAAHCMLTPPENMTVQAGFIDRQLMNSGESRPVLKYLVHEEWNPAEFENDIALVWLKSPFTLPSIKPIRLPIRRDYTTFMQATAYGWGNDENGENVFLLRRGKFHIVPYEKCNTMSTTKGKFCAKGVNNLTTACHGDSGGPLVAFGRLIGIVSYGPGNGKICYSNKPMVFTHVLYYIEWIEKNM